MNKTKEIVCLTTTIKIFRACKMFPSINEHSSIGKLFYIKYAALCILASGVLVGSSLHLFHTLRSKEYNHIDLDLSYVLSILGAYLLNIFFCVNSKKALKMYSFLSDFEEFGKPPKFDVFNERLNKLSKYHLYYILLTNTLFALASNIFRSHQCERENMDYGLNEVCGLINNVWFPFDIDYFPLKQIYITLQIFGVYYVYTPAAMVTFCLLETVLHISVRLDHVKDLFMKSLNDENPLKRRKLFNFTVKYHSRVLKLEDELNDTFSLSVLCLLLLDAAILGCGASGFIKGGSANPLAVCIAWFMGLIVVCISGQHLINKSLSIGVGVCDTNWYNAEASLQRDTVIVLMRCMKPMQVRAAAFGVMDHVMIVTVVQASFSYVRLLTSAASREVDI
nr:odorant receptor [Semanotus bifasciatus]